MYLQYLRARAPPPPKTHIYSPPLQGLNYCHIWEEWSSLILFTWFHFPFNIQENLIKEKKTPFHTTEKTHLDNIKKSFLSETKRGVTCRSWQVLPLKKSDITQNWQDSPSLSTVTSLTSLSDTICCWCPFIYSFMCCLSPAFSSYLFACGTQEKLLSLITVAAFLSFLFAIPQRTHDPESQNNWRFIAQRLHLSNFQCFCEKGENHLVWLWTWYSICNSFLLWFFFLSCLYSFLPFTCGPLSLVFLGLSLDIDKIQALLVVFSQRLQCIEARDLKRSFKLCQPHHWTKLTGFATDILIWTKRQQNYLWSHIHLETYLELVISYSAHQSQTIWFNISLLSNMKWLCTKPYRE